MPVDPSIALSAQANAPNVQQMYTLANMAQQYQQNQQQVDAQNKLKELYQDPENKDAQGNLNQNALTKLMQVDPRVGMQVQQNQLQTRQQQMRVDMLTSDRFQKQMELSHGAYTKSRVAYEKALQDGMSQDQAVQVGQKVLSEDIDELKSSGMFSDSEQNKFRTKFDPSNFDPTDKAYLQYHTFLANQDKAQHQMRNEDVRTRNDTVRTEVAQQRAITGGKHEQLQEKIADAGPKPKWQVLSDPTHKDAEGNPTQYRFNENDGTAFTLDNKPYTPGGAAKIASGSQASVISDDAANYVVDRILAGDPNATTNLGRSAANMTKIENILAQKAKERGISGGQLSAMKATVRADSTSLSNLTKMTDSAVSFENTANKNFDLALKLAPKAIPTNWGPWVNKWVEKGEAGLGGEDVPPYVTALMTAANEYAKIMSGSTGAQGSTVDSRREAAELFSPYLSKGQITEVVSIAKKDMANRKASLNEQLSIIKGRIQNQGQGDSTQRQAEKPQPEADKPKAEAAPEKGFYQGSAAPPEHPEAKKAPDGKWYVGPNKDGKYQPVLMGQ